MSSSRVERFAQIASSPLIFHSHFFSAVPPVLLAKHEPATRRWQKEKNRQNSENILNKEFDNKNNCDGDGARREEERRNISEGIRAGRMRKSLKRE
jgi:hypothetical protein